jgi:hypothetical protein
MKKYIVLGLILMAVMVYAAAPIDKIYYHALGSTKSVDNPATAATAYDFVDSCVIATFEAANCIVTASGIATMDPGDKLYLGLGNTKQTTTSTNNIISDTLVYPKEAKGTIDIPFIIRGVLVTTSTPTTDTVYFNAACGGSATSPEQVFLRNVNISVSVSGV